MGGLRGHVFPGTMFVSFSIWWLIGEVLQKGRKGGNPSSSRRKTRSVAFQPMWYLCPGPAISKIPVEPMTKVILSVIGVLVELPFTNSATLYDVHGEFMAKNLPNYGHATMYCFFGLSGVVDLVMWYKVLPLPPRFDYLVLSLAFWMEGLLFFFHLHRRSELNARLHTILYITAFTTAAVFVLAVISDEILLYMGFLKPYLLSLQGNWFFQITFVLFGQNPWKSNHSNVEFATILFSFHILVLFVIHLTVYTICRDIWIKIRPLNERLWDNGSDEEADLNRVENY